MTAHDLGAVVIKEALKRAQVNPEDVSEVILGQVYTAGKNNLLSLAIFAARRSYSF